MPNKNTASEIELTIIVTVVGGKALVHRCLAAVYPQVNFATTEVIVPYDRWSADVEDLAEEFPSVRFRFINDLGAASAATVSSHQHRLYDRRRAVGLSLARGRLIAMTEDYAVPAEDWCRQIFRAHEQPYAVIGGAIDNGIDRPLNWALYYCDFGRYGNPLEHGPAEYASDVNLAYKREALDSIRDVWSEAYHETTVHWTLRSRGEVVFLDPRLVVYQHRPAIGLFRAVRERIEWGRIFAETRVARCSLWRRVCYAAGTAILPALLLLRVLRNMLRQGRSVTQIVQTLPLTACLLAGWALGEFSGYVRGQQAAEVSLTKTRAGNLTTSQP
jgi:hypothetical protein